MLNRKGSRELPILCGVLLLVSVALQDSTASAETFKPFRLKTPEGLQRSLSDVLGKATLVALIAEWRARHGYTVPVLVGGRSVQRDYKLTMTPTHYLIDSQRNVLLKQVGYRPGDETAIEKAIQEALR